MNTTDIFYKQLSFWLPKVSLILLFTLLLTGCTSTSNQSSSPTPKDATTISGEKLDVNISRVDKDVVFENGQHVIVENGNTITVVTAGSGSCPPLIQHVYLENDTIKLYTKQYVDQPCTMDYRTYPQEIVFLHEGDVFLNKNFSLCSSYTECLPIPSNNAWDGEKV